MFDGDEWWNDLEVVEGLRAPFKELESFSVSIELDDLILFGSPGDTLPVPDAESEEEARPEITLTQLDKDVWKKVNSLQPLQDGCISLSNM